jgi:hypothetical protein
MGPASGMAGLRGGMTRTHQMKYLFRWKIYAKREYISRKGVTLLIRLAGVVLWSARAGRLI